MKIFENTLPVEFIKLIKEESINLSQDTVWRSNLGWDHRIVKSSALVLIRHLNEQQTDFLKQRLIKLNVYPDNCDYSFRAMTYRWSPLSYIPWHFDKDWKGAATIYLNEVWDEDWGGYIMWENSNGVHAASPKFNRMAVNDSNIKHCTSLTTKDSQIRETIQMFWF